MTAKRIALYGKGGIGKTTLSVNLALTMAREGRKVLLVGCDPKADTARLLVKKPPEALVERYDDVIAGRASADQLIVEARDNLWCCESGGPRPGAGCAGRGILIALELLKKAGVLDRMDVVLFDVLGDVVCGGFATPVTKGYADRVYVVTSGEQASLLAANNILRGMAAIGGQIGGLIFNARGFTSEDRLVSAFAQACHVPVAGSLPYDERIKLEELRRRAICDAPSDTPVQEAMLALAHALLSDAPPAQAQPFEPEALYQWIERMGRDDA